MRPAVSVKGLVCESCSFFEIRKDLLEWFAGLALRRVAAAHPADVAEMQGPRDPKHWVLWVRFRNAVGVCGTPTDAQGLKHHGRKWPPEERLFAESESKTETAN